MAGVNAQAGNHCATPANKRFALGRIFYICAKFHAHDIRLTATDARLDARQQRPRLVRRLGIIERIALIDRVDVVKREAKILGDATERSQQRMAHLEIQGLRIVRHPQQCAMVTQINPVFAARIGKV